MSLRINSDFNGVTDPDAGAYIAAVEAADGNQLLEFAVGKAINDFVVGCKRDGIWNAIKASCILAGARTLNGALVPLVGTAPVNNGFTDSQYNRKLGVTNSIVATINTNFNHESLPQNNISMSVFLGSTPTVSGSTFIGVGGGGAGASNIFGSTGGNLLGTRLQSSNFSQQSYPAGMKNFVGSSRSSSSSYVFRRAGSDQNLNIASQAPAQGIIGVFEGAAFNYYISFYHIGEALNLALLDARVTTLINAFGAAIP